MLFGRRAFVALVLAVLASGCGASLERGPECVDIPYDRPDSDERWLPERL
jgi:hypothetical protein